MLSSRSSRYFLMYGAFMRAVTFQSMARMSSPGSYSRTSSKSSPEPRNTLRYVPRRASSARIRALISTCFTTRRTSGGTGSRCGAAEAVTPKGPLRCRERDRYDLRRDLLSIRFVGDDEPMPHDVQRHGFDVIGQDVIAAVEERVRTGREGDVDRGARRDAVGDQGFQVRER